MKFQKIAIYFDEEETRELEIITLDEDEKAALEFLKRLKHKIEVQQRSICGTKTVRGQ